MFYIPRDKTNFTVKNIQLVSMQYLLQVLLHCFINQYLQLIKGPPKVLWHELQMPNPTHGPGAMRIPKQQMLSQPAMVSNAHLKNPSQMTSPNTVAAEGFVPSQPRIIPMGGLNPGLHSFLHCSQKIIGWVQLILLYITHRKVV